MLSSRPADTTTQSPLQPAQQVHDSNNSQYTVYTDIGDLKE